MLIETLKEIVGPNGWTVDAADLEPHLTEWRNVVRGATPIMVKPATTDEVSAVVRACAAAGVAIVPQGGNTGMCAGAVPDPSGEQVLLNLSRMNRIRSVDAADFSLVADAGCVLANLQRAAEEVDRLFPLSLGGEGTCQIGGNLATDAGGINVIRYGTTRDLVLGVEAVLADGRVYDGLRTLRKDTAGYDLKQLFIGSEGTLGIITGVAVKLFPAQEASRTAMLAIDDAEKAVELLGVLRGSLDDAIQSFELIGMTALDLVLEHIPDTRLPFESAAPWYVLLEATTGEGDRLERALLPVVNSGLARDAVIAKNDRESDALWRMRHSISEAEKKIGQGVKHDISVPIGRMRDFLTMGDARLAEQIPEATLVAFGHVGDGNLHYNVVLPKSLLGDDLVARRKAVSRLVYDLVAELNGSISAEHGIGVLKRDWLHEYKDPVELDLMRTLKTALDPHSILNPGKVI